MKTISISILLGLFLASCSTAPAEKNELQNLAKGTLYIIGGGKRPASMVDEMIQLSELTKPDRYGIVLPMASEEPDTAFYYFTKPFKEKGVANLFNFHVNEAQQLHESYLDSVRKASFIFISGGDQNRFMEIVEDSPLHFAIREAYLNGALIGGTSAGAAVQSEKMITGNELKHPEYTGNYRSIEAENIEIGRGLGLLPTAIIDQHFIRRMRMNRLIAAAIENPDALLIGIDESTAIVVRGDSATVTGVSQVVVLQNKNNNIFSENGMLGSSGMQLDVYLPGQKFCLISHP